MNLQKKDTPEILRTIELNVAIIYDWYDLIIIRKLNKFKTRTDTNEEIESREMTEDEKQGKMFDDADAEKATGEAQK